jgi:hypothetical protein
MRDLEELRRVWDLGGKSGQREKNRGRTGAEIWRKWGRATELRTEWARRPRHGRSGANRRRWREMRRAEGLHDPEIWAVAGRGRGQLGCEIDEWGRSPMEVTGVRTRRKRKGGQPCLVMEEARPGRSG